MRWAKKHNECSYCETTFRPHNAKGLCRSCYKVNIIHLKLKGITNLDELAPYFIKYLGVREFSRLNESKHSMEQKKEILTDGIDQYYLKFHYLYKITQKNDNVNLLHFERIFNEVSNKISGRKKKWDQKLGPLYNSLNTDQRKNILFQLIKMIS